jgi:uncharacterized repeat protein (TIGR04076 family)
MSRSDAGSLSNIEVTVVSITGKCSFGHKVGDKIYFDGKKIRGDICLHGLQVILPTIIALQYGADFPWATHESEGDAVTDACPDAHNLVVYRLKRTKTPV